jgi:hypothetical protein
MHAPFLSVESPFPNENEGRKNVEWSQHQLQLLDWFTTEAPSLAHPYRAAVILMNDISFPARVYLVCHVVRDIYNKLPEALVGASWRREANEINPIIDDVSKHWEQYTGESFTQHTGGTSTQEALTQVSVSVIAVKKVGELLDLRRKLKEQPTSAEVLAQALYKRFVEYGTAPSRRLIQTFEKERRWFTGRAHLVRDSEKIPSDNDLDEHFETFERTLHSLVAPHFSVQQDLNDILHKANQ